MPVFTIETPSGKTLTIEADDEATALKGAQEWHAQNGKPGAVEDVAKSVAPSVARGAAGLLGLPRGVTDIVGGAADLVAQIPGRVYNRVAGDGSWNMPESALRGAAEADKRTLNADPRRVMPSQGDVVKALEDNVTGPLYKAQTTPGKYASSAIEFGTQALAGGGGLPAAILYGAVPGIASEAAGQLSEGKPWEPYARAGAAIATAGGIAAFNRPSYVERMVGRAAGDVTPQQYAAADALMRDAAARGINLTPAEAIQQVTGGATQLGNVQRIAESTADGGARLSPFFARRPQDMSQAVANELDQIAPRSATPGMLGRSVQEAAESVVGQARGAVNNATRPDYNAATVLPNGNPRTIGALRNASLMRDPIYAETLQNVRNNPALNQGIANLPDDAVAVVDRVQRVMRESAEGLRNPAQPGSSNIAAAAIDSSRSRPLAQADAVTGGRYGDYARARARQMELQEAIVDPLQAGPVGAIRATDDVGTQGKALIGEKASPQEVAQATQLLSGTNPTGTRELLREALGRRAEKTVDELTRRGLPDQFGGAQFAGAIRANPRVAANTDAAITAGAGQQRSESFNRLLDALQATGWRQDRGSMTAFNQEMLRDMERGGAQAVGRAISKPASTFSDAVARARLGSQSERLAELLMGGPDGVRRIQELAARGDDRAQIIMRLLLAEQAAAQ